MRISPFPKKDLKVDIKELPDVASTVHNGCMYGITITNKLIRNIFILRNFDQFLKNNKSILFITHNSRDWIHSLSELEEQMGLDVLSSIRIAEFMGNLHNNIKSHGTHRLFIEIEDLQLKPKSIIFIDTTRQDIGAIDNFEANSLGYQIRKWLNVWKHIAFFISSDRDVYTHPYFTGFQHNLIFDGIADLNSDFLRLIWHIDIWKGNKSTIANKSYGIYFDKDSYSLQADGASIDGRSGKLLYAPDEDLVLITRQDVQGETNYPETWVICEGFSELLKSLTTAVAATVILIYEKSITFSDILDRANTIRSLTGPTLKLIVRERDLSLRYYQEAILLQSGVNMVVFRNENTSRLLRAIELLKHECYAPTTRATSEEIGQIMNAKDVSGYLAPIPFCEFVKEKLSHSNILDLQSALIKLQLLPDIPIIDAIKDFKPKRSGDVITADKHNIFIYLYACRSPDITATLANLFTQGVDPMYSHEIQITSFEGIRETIELLKFTAKTEALVDYSLYL